MKRRSPSRRPSGHTPGRAHTPRFEENIKGSLAPGKLGDVTVLNADARTVDPDDIAEIGIDYTIMDGEIVYRA